MLVPDLSADQVSIYLDDLVGPRDAEPTDAAARPETAARVSMETVAPADLRSPQVDAALADPGLSATHREALEILRVRREATPAAAKARSEHLLHAYAALMPANPRLIKRIANALGMLLAIKSHVRHSEDEDAMARAAILFVQFPVLASRLLTEDITAAATDFEPSWQQAGVRNVRGRHSLEALARCLGRATTDDAAHR